jgi:hypothetical protein
MQFCLYYLQDNQKDLENATEQLSEYLERDITSDILVDIKQKVQDKSRYAQINNYSPRVKLRLYFCWNTTLKLDIKSKDPFNKTNTLTTTAVSVRLPNSFFSDKLL